MLYFFIILLIILLITALILFAVTIPYLTINLHYKDKLLTVIIGNRLFKKKLTVDFSEKEKVENKSKTDNKKTKKPKPDFKSKINEIKARIFNPDTGFNIDEARAVKSEIFELYSDFMGAFKKFLDKARYKIYIPNLTIRLEYGTGNPANTGLIYGSIWSFVGLLYPFAARYFHMAYPSLDITPDFYGKRFDAEIKSIIKVRPTHIINAAVAAFSSLCLTYVKNKFKKGRENND